MNRMEKYHADYVSQRKAPPLVAVTPAAMEIEQRAIARENKGQYRLAARLWQAVSRWFIRPCAVDGWRREDRLSRTR